MRRPLEGMWNVVRFNWPRYALGVAMLIAFAGIASSSGGMVRVFAWMVAVLSAMALVLPLVASYWIYDRSELYKMPWLPRLPPASTVLNLHAGFDESTGPLRERYPGSSVVPLDLYDPLRHTEPSIERARRRQPPLAGTRHISTSHIPYPDRSADLVIGFLALHEVRDPAERLQLLKEVRRALHPNGTLVITEHLRDLPNFMAFSFGFLHFHSLRTWSEAFGSAGFRIARRLRTTPFITTFLLRPE